MSELTDVLARQFFNGIPQDILVIGCRMGQFARELSATGHRVWACQESLPLTLQLQAEAERTGSEVEFFTADPLHVQPFSDNFFGSVIIEEEVGCTGDIDALFEEACRLTKAGGGLVAGTHLRAEYSARRQRRCFNGRALITFIRCFGELQRVQCLETGFVFWLRIPEGSHD